MQLHLQIQGLQEAQRRIAQVPRQARFAAALALNDAAFGLREDWREEMRRVFDRPTPYVVDSIWVGKKARPDSLQAWVYPRDRGGKGVDPEKVLLAEVFGGVRRPKRFEVALRRAGVLPGNMAAVPAGWVTSDPTTSDSFGNVKGSFIVRLLSQLRAFGEQGYRANATDRSRARLAKRRRSERGFVTIQGVEYFVSRGRGEYATRRAASQRQTLPAGIWQRRGIHGSDVKPVFLFTRMPRYRVRLPVRQLAERALGERFPAAFSARFQRAMETAR